MTFIDDYSKFCYINLLKSKDEFLDWFKLYKAEAENQLKRKIKILRSDRGGEYITNDMSGFCQEDNIIHEVTAPYTHQSNGVTEQKNKTLMDIVNCMLISSDAPKNLWGEALLSAYSIINRIPQRDFDAVSYTHLTLPTIYSV